MASITLDTASRNTLQGNIGKILMNHQKFINLTLS